MRQELADGDGAARRFEERFAGGGVEAAQDLWTGKAGEDGAGIPVEVEQAAFDELHDRDRGDRLCHGGDHEEGVQPEGRSRLDVGEAPRALVARPAGIDGDGRQAGQPPRGDGLPGSTLELVHHDLPVPVCQALGMPRAL